MFLQNPSLPTEGAMAYVSEGGCKDTWKKEFKLPWREAGPPDHHECKADSGQ